MRTRAGAGPFCYKDAMTFHILKLCVGCGSVEELASWQSRRLATMRQADPRAVLMHVTRQTPRRQGFAPGSSMYWVIGGYIAGAPENYRASRGSRRRRHPPLRIGPRRGDCRDGAGAEASVSGLALPRGRRGAGGPSCGRCQRGCRYTAGDAPGANGVAIAIGLAVCA